MFVGVALVKRGSFLHCSNVFGKDDIDRQSTLILLAYDIFEPLNPQLVHTPLLYEHKQKSMPTRICTRCKRLVTRVYIRSLNLL